MEQPLKKQFTYRYSQPEEYHFSLDSIELAFRAAQRTVGLDLTSGKVLDLCSGCGVIGLDYHFYHPQIEELYFLEVQKQAYELHFLKNSRMIQNRSRFIPLWTNYENLLTEQFKNCFDLILSNPPYFDPDQGRLSPSDFKNRCRFFLDSDFQRWVSVILHSLKVGGSAYVLLRPLHQHGKERRLCLDQMSQRLAEVRALDVIRGTEMLEIKKL